MRLRDLLAQNRIYTFDRLVYGLYGLSDEEIGIVGISWNIGFKAKAFINLNIIRERKNEKG